MSWVKSPSCGSFCPICMLPAMPPPALNCAAILAAMAAAAAAASEAVFPSSVFGAFTGCSSSGGVDSGAAWSHLR